MIKTLSEFQAKRDLILKRYDAILACDILPVGDITAQSVLDRRERLQAEQFTIAVCGQIKAGKSTLLNALAFHAPILPYDDTPLTAKLTFIRHGAKREAKVCFYSKEEWAHVCAARVGDDAFKASIDFCITEGNYVDEYIHDTSYERTIVLDALRDYVGQPGLRGGRKQGMFTPYVKHVSIIENIPWLKDVTIVDTPGINDPCRMNSETTEKWIHMADAVIYVMYAGAAGDRSDVDFINKAMLGVSRSHRIVAVNKSDSADIEEVKPWLESMKDSPDPRIRNVFSDAARFHYVCALGGLIDEMQTAGLELDKNLNEWQGKRGKADFLAPEKHGMVILRQAVEEQLLANRGNALLSSSEQFLNGVFAAKQAELTSRIEALKEKLTYVDTDHAALKQKLQENKRSRGELAAFVKKTRNEWERNLDKVRNDALQSINEHKASAIKAAKEELKTYRDKSIATIVSDMPWVAKNALESIRPELFKSMAKASENLSTYLGTIQLTVQSFLDQKSSMSTGAVNTLLYIPMSRLLCAIEKMADEKLADERLAGIVTKHAGFWEKWRGRLKQEGALEGALVSQMRECIITSCKEFIDEALDNKLIPEAASVFTQIAADIQEALEDRDKAINDILNATTHKDLLRRETENEIKGVDDELIRVNAMQKEVLK